VAALERDARGAGPRQEGERGEEAGGRDQQEEEEEEQRREQEELEVVYSSR
jgi:hypothetical protein